MCFNFLFENIGSLSSTHRNILNLKNISQINFIKNESLQNNNITSHIVNILI